MSRSWAAVAGGAPSPPSGSSTDFELGLQQSTLDASRDKSSPSNAAAGLVAQHDHQCSSTDRRSVPSAHAANLPQKERDQLRLAELLARKEARAAQERALSEFQHEQMIKRWAAGKQNVKPNRALYLSDFLGGDTTVAAAATTSSSSRGALGTGKSSKPVPVPVPKQVALPVSRSTHADPVSGSIVGGAGCASPTNASAGGATPQVLRPVDGGESGTLKIHRNRRDPVPALGNVPTIDEPDLQRQHHSAGAPPAIKPKRKRAQVGAAQRHEDEVVTASGSANAAAAPAVRIASVPLAGAVAGGRSAAVRRATRSESPRSTFALLAAAGGKRSKRVSAVKRLVWHERRRVFLQQQQLQDREEIVVTKVNQTRTPVVAATEACDEDAECTSSNSSGSILGEERKTSATRPQAKAAASQDYHEAEALVQELEGLHRLVAELRQEGNDKGATTVLRKLRRRKEKLMRISLRGDGNPPVAVSDRKSGTQAEKDDAKKPDDSPAAVCEVESDDEETVTLSKPMMTAMSRAFFYPLLAQYRGASGWHPLQHLLDRRNSRADCCNASDGGVGDTGIVSTPQRNEPRAAAAVRDYCVNVLTDALDQAAWSFLVKLQAAQKKLKTQQPMHFRSRMRFVSGLKEVMRSLSASRVRLVLVAPDVEPVAAAPPSSAEAPDHVAPQPPRGGAPGAPPSLSRRTVRALGLDGSVAAVVEQCAQLRVPWVCCLSRRRLGHALRLGSSCVSVVAILSAESAYDEYRVLVGQVRDSCSEYHSLLSAGEEKRGEKEMWCQCCE